MPNYIHIEENDDNTTTFVTNINGEEQTYLLPMDFEDIFNSFMNNAPSGEMMLDIAEMIVEIPNEI